MPEMKRQVGDARSDIKPGVAFDTYRLKSNRFFEATD
jgi:hypothetical protein